MRIKATTATGSFYHINTETGRWQKNASYWMQYHMISKLRVGDFEDRRVGAFASGPLGTWDDAELPEVGKCLFIQGKGMSDWWASTPVVSIEEDPDDWPEELDEEVE
jgi:hypothetical protein